MVDRMKLTRAVDARAVDARAVDARAVDVWASEVSMSNDANEQKYMLFGLLRWAY